MSVFQKQKQKLTKKNWKRHSGEPKPEEIIGIALTKKIYEESKRYRQYLAKELWLMGVMLYWAEGHKEKNIGRDRARNLPTLILK